MSIIGSMVGGVRRLVRSSGNGTTPAIIEKEQKDTDSVNLVAHLDALAEEGEQGWLKPIDSENSIVSHWDLCIQQFNGDQEGGKGDREGIHYTTINRTQPATMTQVANATATPPKVTFGSGLMKARRSYYLSEYTRKLIGKGAIANTFSAAQLDAMEPLEEEQAVALVATYGADAVIELTSEKVIKFIQAGYERVGLTCGRAEYIEQCQLWTSIVGTGWFALQWDSNRHQPVYINAPIRNVRCDSTRPNIRDQEFVTMDYFVSARKLLEQFPEKREMIIAAAMTGNAGAHRSSYSTVNGSNYQRGSTAKEISSSSVYGSGVLAENVEGINFQRRMVWVRVVWERGHKFPMREAEAVDEGAVKKKGDGYVLVDENGLETDIVVAPGDKEWPTTLGIRQSTYIPYFDEESVLEVIRCPFADIPMGKNINIEMVDSPYGIGEPYRSRHIQTAINRLGTDIMTHYFYYRYPQEWMPASLLAWIESNTDVAINSHPGKVIGVDDNLYRTYFSSGRTSFASEIPALPAEAIDLFQLWISLLDSTQQNAGVLNGESPGSNASGRTVLALQNEAKTIIGVKARKLKFMMMRMAEIELDALLRFGPPAKWAQWTGISEEPMLVNALLREARRMRFTVNVEVVGDDGSMKEIKKVEASEARANGDLSRRTYFEITGIVEDAEQEELRILEELQKGMPTPTSPGVAVKTGQPMPGQPAPAPQPVAPAMAPSVQSPAALTPGEQLGQAAPPTIPPATAPI